MWKFTVISICAFSLPCLLLTGCANDTPDLLTEEDTPPQNPEEIITEKDDATATMQLIPAGEFEMGTTEAEADQLVLDFAFFAVQRSSFEDEVPRHSVYLDDFYLDVYEVTNAQYAKFLNAVSQHVGDDGKEWLEVDDANALIKLVYGEYRPKAGFADHPVTKVSWYGAAAYAQWAEKRLPTEAEWEKAARGGLDGKRYPWGNEISQDNANYLGAEGAKQWERTSPVGSFPPNGYGLHDMAGNVWEWCMDEYQSGFYANSPKENPIAGGLISFMNNSFTSVNTVRVLRGGSWNLHFRHLRVASRNSRDPTDTRNNVGFRCALTP